MLIITSLTVETLITLTYQYKIKPRRGQIKQFEQYLNICRSVYNFAHAERKDWLFSRKSKVDCCSIVREKKYPPETDIHTKK
ncbi:MAG: helix-turn-helix domain-containing protein, partial [Prochloraceae cyanobacterium]